ncbi:LysR family transcriptional regulator [Melittangium boletus]|uniref:LysR family transcriptional regulator n=1 Tax=Melittangium boletus DSM 14713 TaxID=1294270 RepID=A0A250IMU9_9BACT|nr:LysR family transcriptional regulator [Melittangium boletus]ATB32256.1 LysR family transcriptional regulator [Melittangium boletus DSM 14713]
MDRLETLRVFVTVAEEAGFASAARRLAMSPPAVTRAIAALEERIGTRLLHRTTRIVRLTETGTRFLADCKRILGELEEAEASAAGSHTEPRGQLGVTASLMFGRMFIAPLLLDFLARHPRVMARTLLVDRVVDLVDEGLDVAIRIAHLEDSTLTAVRVGSVRRVVCASPRYLAEHGIPRTPAELSRFEAFTLSSTVAPQPWAFASGTRNQTVSPPTRLIVNTTEVAIAAAVAGRGLTRVLSYQIAPELRAGQLRIVLEDFEPPPLPIHVVYPEGRRANARVRAFVDFAVERLRAEKSLNP